MRLWLDLETYSEVPIKNGTHRYAEAAEVMLWAYAIDDGPIQVWDVTSGSAMPADLEEALLLADEVWAHNSGFDRTVLRHTFGALCPEIGRWRDTMVQALSHSLPGALGTLCEVMGVEADEAKDKEGKQLVMLFCKPLGANRKLRRATSETHPEQWAKFIGYAGRDISAMRVIQKRMPAWNYPDNKAELALWHLDQLINDRGVAVDVDLAKAAVEAVARAQEALAEQTLDLTLGQVSAATKRQALMDYLLDAHGFIVNDLQGATVDRKLADPDLDPAVRELLLVRQQASTSSTAKYKALMGAVSRDGRVRGLLQFNGAARTGRWCLAEGSLVRTLNSNGTVTDTPIELVRVDQLVWDGIAWVAHEGVVFSGVREVIEHSGVRASPDHVVHLTQNERVTLAVARARNQLLWKGDECSMPAPTKTNAERAQCK